MRIAWLLSIFLWNLINHTALSGRIIQCKPPKVINADISCTTNPLPNGNFVNLTRCTIFCKKGHIRTDGPSTIDCYRANWLNGGDDHIPYSKPTKCKLKPTPFNILLALGRRSRLLQFGPVREVQHDGMCSDKYCNRRYSGITKSVCSGFKCCWNKAKEDCFEYLPPSCQVRISQRVRCPGTWNGISQQQCKNRKCCYIDATSECYSSKVGVEGTQITATTTSVMTTTLEEDEAAAGPTTAATSTETLEEDEAAAGPTTAATSTERLPDACELPRWKTTRCPNTWEGIPKFLCLAFRCCYDEEDALCYSSNIEKPPTPRFLIAPRPPAVKAACEPPSIPKGAELNCTDGYNKGTVCSITCPPNTVLRGKKYGAVLCLESALWQNNFSDACVDIPRCGELQTLYPSAPWDMLTVVCSSENMIESVCEISCGDYGVESVATACTVNSKPIDKPTWSDDPPSRCIDVTTKPCDLEIDLSDGKLTYSDESFTEFVKIIDKPQAPIWSRSLASGKGNCDYQSLLEIQYEKLKALTLRMNYNIPSRHNFHLTSKENSVDSGKSIWATSYHLNGISGISGRGLIPSKSDVTFLMRKSSSGILFKVADKDIKLPVDFSSQRILKVGLNRAVFLKNAYDISNMGSGMCRFCIAFL